MELGGRKGDEQGTYPKGSIDSQEEEDEYRCYGRGVHVGWTEVFGDCCEYRQFPLLLILPSVIVWRFGHTRLSDNGQ